MDNLLSQNSKMKKTSSKNDVSVFNFGIPAFRSKDGLVTCPMASKCVTGCYAKAGTFIFKNVRNAYEERLRITHHPSFVEIMDLAIKQKSKIYKNVFIRIHDSGDFYSHSYLMNWIRIINMNPDVKFYAYTKMVSMFKSYQLDFELPKNFLVIYSFGGREDSLIDVKKDRHAVVFESEKRLKQYGYVNASGDDIMALGTSKLIGLVYHGVKSFKNTTWGKVECNGIS